MHTIRGGWVGQTFALATSNDSGGRKSRIRRSKEERKTMIESFVKKYQKSNNGNFPSLNLTHKEVGGSFYTVREIVREIIQENRVLGPSKLFSEVDNSEFLEQHPVGSISFDPRNGLSLSDKTHAVTHTASDGDQITSGEHIFTFSPQFHGPETMELDNRRIVDGQSEADENDGGSDELSMRHSATIHHQDCSKDDVLYFTEPFPQSNSQKCVEDQIVNGSETFEKDQECDKPTITNTIPIHQDSTFETSVLSSGMFPGPGSQRLSDEQIVDKNSQINEKQEAVTYMEAVVEEILDREKDRVKELETSEAVISHKKPEVLVETFPLMPVSKTIHDMDGEVCRLSDVTGALEEKANQHEGIMFTNSSSVLINGKVEEKLPSLESSDFSTTTEATSFDGSIVKDVEAKDSLPDGTKTSDSPKQSILKEPTAVGRKPYLQDNGSFQKESNPMLDRINLETWERTSKKSPDPNPLLTLLKGFISAFVKFWSE
ncbi:DNA binding [Forsythia ovata]|uniref:DNA binding n=1 Tax=Forsythia ovata TaxID=205694 RepID=A0ABD1WYK3_9LAMI